MYLPQIPNNSLSLSLLVLCVLTMPACDKRKESPSNPQSTSDTKIKANKIWNEFKSGRKVTGSPLEGEFVAVIKDRIDARNDLAKRDDLESFVATGRLESSIAIGIADALKLNNIDVSTARELTGQIASAPLVPSKLAAALNLRLNPTQAKLISDTTNRYASFRALFQSLPEAPDDIDSKQMTLATYDEWLMSGKYPYLTLAFVVQSKVQLSALSALVQFVEKGGNLTLSPAQLKSDLEKVIPECFGFEQFPEASGLRLRELSPNDVMNLIVRETNSTSDR